MKVRKYGSFEFAERKELKFAVMVYCYGKGFKFVTKIDRETKTWEAEDGQHARFFDRREHAQDLAFSICCNGVSAYVVEVFQSDLWNDKVDNETEIK